MDDILQNILKPTFKGVVGRKEYWLTLLFSGILKIIVVGILIASINSSNYIVFTIFCISFLYLEYSGLCIMARRMHDIGTSAMLLLLLIFLGPIVTIITIIIGFIPTDYNSKYRNN